MTGVNKVTSPVPQGKYVPAKRHGDLVFLSGMTPRRNGVLTMSGKVKSSEPIKLHSVLEDYIKEYVNFYKRDYIIFIC